MATVWLGTAGALEAATAVCAALNLTYFLERATSLNETRPRRVAASALALVSLGAMVESVVVLGWVAASDAAVFRSAPWTAVSVVTFAGMAAVLALVAWRSRE